MKSGYGRRLTGELEVRWLWHWPRSLHVRLVLIPAALLAVGLLGTIGVIFLHARSRISAEVTSGVQLGHDLATAALLNVVEAGSRTEAFESLERSLPRVRHVQFELEAFGNNRSHETLWRIGDKVHSYSEFLAPLLAPAPVEQRFPVVVGGATVGRLTVRSNPSDEISEIIGEVELFSGVLIGLCFLTVGGLLITVRHSLRPLQSLSDGFDRLEQGNYETIAVSPVRELDRVSRQFNSLAGALQRITSDNRLLIDRLFSMQDRERKELAAELHDEFGPVLFAIRAETACILRVSPSDVETRARAQSIAELTDGIQRTNYRILERLRPLILEEMGLAQALRHLVTSWKTRYPQISWSLDVAPGFDDRNEAEGLTLYRAAQEGITNAIRHAGATIIEVRLKSGPPGKAGLVVRDNGRGLPVPCRYGFGLLGMAERVRQLGGSLTVSSTGPGVTVEVSLPTQGQKVTEATHADPVD